MTIDPAVFYSGIGAIAMAIAFGIRQIAMSWGYREKARADNATTQENASANANSALIDIAKQGVVYQQQMIKVVEENTRANEKSAAEMRGMVTMMDGFGTVLKGAILGWDEAQGHIPVIRENAAHIPSIRDNVQAIRETTSSLETNLEGSISDQFAPVVTALTSIGTQLSVLVVEVKTKDGEINGRLTSLIEAFQSAETRMLKILEPIAIVYARNLAKQPSEETPRKEEGQNHLPVDIRIEAAKEQK